MFARRRKLAGDVEPGVASGDAPRGENTSTPSETGDAQSEPSSEREDEPQMPRVAKPPKPQRQPQRSKQPSTRNVETRLRGAVRKERRRLWDSLGLDGEFDETKFDERVANLRKGEGSPTNPADSTQTSSKLAELREQNEELQAQVSTLQSRLSKSQRDLQVQKDEMEFAKVEWDLEARARALGVNPEDADYVKHRFRQHVEALPEGQEANFEQFIEGLKSKNKHLFAAGRVAAGPPSAAEQRAAANGQQSSGPESSAQGANGGQRASDATGSESGTGEPDAPKDVDSMSQREFADYVQQKYQHRPSRYG